MFARLLVVSAFFVGMFSAVAPAKEGVTPSEVRFAQVAGLEGPFGLSGRRFGTGVRAAFEEANSAGGVNGRMVLLDSFEDGNEPENSVVNVRRILREDGHLGFVGTSGVQSSRVVQTIIKKAKAPFLAPLSGDPMLREIAMMHVRTIRPGIAAEAEAWIGHLVDDAGLERIAVLYQADLFGRQGVAEVAAALERRGLELVTRGSYPRNTLAVKMPLVRIRKRTPQAVIIIGEQAAAASFIEMGLALEFDPVYVIGSTVPAAEMAAALGEDAAGLVATGVLPQGSEGDTLLARSCSEALGDEAAGPLACEGYLSGRFILEILEAAGPELDRATFNTAMRKLREVEIEGVRLEFGLGDNQALDEVHLARLTPEGHVVSLKE